MTALLLLAFCVVCLMHSQSWFMVSEIYGIYISYYSSPSHPKVYLLSLTFPPLAITLSQVAWLLRTFCPDIAGIWILMQFCCFPPTMASLQRLSSRGRGAENRGEKSVVAYLYIHISLIYIHVCQYAEHVTTQRILSCEACQRRCSALIKPTSHFTAPLIRPPPWSAPTSHPPFKCKCQRAVAVAFCFSAHALRLLRTQKEKHTSHKSNHCNRCWVLI